MTVYVTGDVHGRAEYGASRFAFKSWPLGRTLTRDDVVIVAGDFGFVWMARMLRGIGSTGSSRSPGPRVS